MLSEIDKNCHFYKTMLHKLCQTFILITFLNCNIKDIINIMDQNHYNSLNTVKYRYKL